MIVVGSVEVMVEVIEMMLVGYVVLFNGFGLDYIGDDGCIVVVGVVLNVFILMRWCDFYVGIFWYKYVFVVIC